MEQTDTTPTTFADRSWKLGNLTIDGPLVLGPMAGYTALPLRVLCRRAGADLVFSEMVSAKGLSQYNAKTRALLETCAEEKPVAVQLFGGDAAVMADAVPVVEEYGADVIDINMGCPVAKVLRSEGGAALIAYPDRAVEIAAAVVERATVPVTCKIRAGWADDDDGYIELAQRLQGVGAAAITLHARTVRQGFRGEANHAHTRRLVEALRIPVIASGDVFAPSMPLALLQDTGCAGVMIARGAIGRPWAFTQAKAVLRGETPPADPPAALRFGYALCQTQMLVRHCDLRTAMHEMRSQLTGYCKGLPHGAVLRRGLSRVYGLRELAALFAEYLHTLPVAQEQPVESGLPEE